MAIEGLQRFARRAIVALERLMAATPSPSNYLLAEVRPVRAVADPADVPPRTSGHPRSGERLGLGDQPVINLRATLRRRRSGLRIFYGDLPVARSPACTRFVADLGVLHPRQPRTTRPSGGEPRWSTSAAHVLIVDRHRPGDRLPHRRRAGSPPTSGSPTPSPSRFLDARHLAPAAVSTRPSRTPPGDFQVADLCRLAHAYFVSVEAMTVPAGTVSA